MPTAPNVIINEFDLSFTAEEVIFRIIFVVAELERGPINSPVDIVNNEAQFVQLFGDVPLNATQHDAILCRRALQGGARLRIANVRHYTDIADESTLTAVDSEMPFITVLELSDELIAAHTLEATVNGTPLIQAFDTTSDNTLSLFAAQVAALGGNIVTAYAMDPTPTGATSNDTRTIAIVSTSSVTLAALAVTGAPAVTLSALPETQLVIDAQGNPLFGFTPKFPGNSNQVGIRVLPPSNGAPGFFDILVVNSETSRFNERYSNLQVQTVTDTDANFLQQIRDDSFWVSPTYVDLSALAAIPTPYFRQLSESPVTLQFQGGTNGDPTTDNDFIGSPLTGTGLYAFDEFDDSFIITVIGQNSAPILAAGDAYARNRQDLVYFGHIGGTAKQTVTQLVAEREATNIDSSFTALFGGSLEVRQPRSGQQIRISEMGDILGLAANSQERFGPWWSFGGESRGVIRNALGVVNNFGTPARYDDLNTLANRQIAMVVQENGRILLRGNYTAQISSSRLSFLGVRMLLIYIRKRFIPILRRFLEEPVDFITFRRIFDSVRPELEFLSSPSARAILGTWRWEGDQFATSFNNLTVNNSTDLDKGLYKANLFITPIVSLQEIELNIGITRNDNVNIAEVQ